ncbi:MAG: transposase [Acidaminobacter sp.]|uniref:transposase n=1 Tax=Acidaminobacter sp. TaxID=1872102 RepID=UPI0013837D92|nr:transposase [Acidaminobacter sp.]MZQ98967.1 transposase [Acidaminobacter sp.]
MAYTRRVKETAIRMMLPPESVALSKISETLGVAPATLKKWRNELRANGYAAPGNEAPADQWSSQDKFLIVVETMNLNEVELSEYCRKKGLYPEQVKQWQENCMTANGNIPSQVAELVQQDKALQKELRQVRKELQRKESALAEAAALLILRKKAEAIWGTPDEDE